MIEATTRPLSPVERRVLENLARPSASGGAPLGALLTFIVVLGGLLVLAPPEWQIGVRSLAPVGVAVVAAATVFVRLRRSALRTPWLRRSREDLVEDVASVTTYHVTDALAVEESEDEGSQYFLRLEDGRVLFLAGQYLYDAEEAGQFPSARVTLVRAPRSGTVLDLRCAGQRLAVLARRPPFTSQEHRDGHVPEDGAVLAVDFDGLRPTGRDETGGRAWSG